MTAILIIYSINGEMKLAVGMSHGTIPSNMLFELEIAMICIKFAIENSGALIWEKRTRADQCPV
jgi:hypothetical protein